VINKNMDLLDASAALGKTLKLGYNDCIFCNRQKKLKVTQSYYRCYHPDCAKHGTVTDFIKEIKNCSLRDAQSFLSQSEGGSNTGWKKRIDFLEKVFVCYRQAITDEVLEFLNGRGYYTALEEIPFGFAPSSNYLQSCGFKLSALVEQGLAYPTGKEFFQNRVVFGIRDLRGNLVHLQGRSVVQEESLRWLSTPTVKGVSSINNYLFEGHYYRSRENIDWLFLAEGISDGLSLIELDVPAVSCFGVQIDLCHFLNIFSKVSNLCVVLDNDRYPLLSSQNAGLYKSWTPMIYSLVELQKMLPRLHIWCCPPPNVSGVKDVNDWLRQGISPTSFAEYVQSHATKLLPFALTALGGSWEHQPILIKSLGDNPRQEELELFKNCQQSLEPDPTKYLLKAFRYV